MFEEVKYAFFDLDGTLIPEGKTISTKTQMAFSYLKSLGIRVGIATGRSPYFVEPLADLLQPNLPYVCINGAQILDANFKTISEKLFPKSAYQIFDILSNKKIHFLIYSNEGVFFSDINHPFRQRLWKIFSVLKFNQDFKFDVNQDLNFYKNKDFYKVLISFKNDEEKSNIEAIIKDFNDVTYASSQSNVLDIYSKLADKALGIEYVSKILNISNDEIIVFGDNENDINMFKKFKNSVCLKNSKDYAKVNAKFTTDFDCTNDGVADFIFKNF